jgi:hypothetical protein
LQDLGATARQAALAIQGLQDQARRFGNVSGFSCCPRTAIQLSLLLFKPLSFVTSSRITGWN